MASHLKNCAAISYPRRGDFLRRLLRRVFPRRADLLCLFSSRAMLRKARKAVMSKQPELLYISLDAMFFPLLYHAEAAKRRLRGVLSCVLIQTALRFRHSRCACNLLMQPFTGLPATVAITLGRTVGSICLCQAYSPATKPGCSAKAGGQWQKVRCLIEYSVFKLHTHRRAEAVTGSGAGAHLEKMPSPCRH